MRAWSASGRPSFRVDTGDPGLNLGRRDVPASALSAFSRRRSTAQKSLGRRRSSAPGSPIANEESQTLALVPAGSAPADPARPDDLRRAAPGAGGLERAAAPRRPELRRAGDDHQRGGPLPAASRRADRGRAAEPDREGAQHDGQPGARPAPDLRRDPAARTRPVDAVQGVRRAQGLVLGRDRGQLLAHVAARLAAAVRPDHADVEPGRAAHGTGRGRWRAVVRTQQGKNLRRERPQGALQRRRRDRRGEGRARGGGRRS